MDKNEKVLLVHGYGVGLDNIFKKNEVSDLSFYEAYKYKDKLNLDFYDWIVTKSKLGVVDTFNPIKQIGIYVTERRYVKNLSNQKRLAEYINNNKVTKIIAHSMGSKFVLQTLKNYGIECVKKIIVLQGDMERNLIDVDARLDSTLEIINYYNPLDYTLFSSVIINRCFRSGQIGFKNKDYKNIKLKNILYIPDFKSLDIHNNILRNKNFWSKLLSK